MNIDIVYGKPIPPSVKAGNTKPEYAEAAEKLQSMEIGGSFVVSPEEAKKIRYIAARCKVHLTSRTNPKTEQVEFWRTEPSEKKRKVAAPAAGSVE